MICFPYLSARNGQDESDGPDWCAAPDGVGIGQAGLLDEIECFAPATPLLRKESVGVAAFFRRADGFPPRFKLERRSDLWRKPEKRRCFSVDLTGEKRSGEQRFCAEIWRQSEFCRGGAKERT
jgi:hypothetical protein